MKKHIHFVNFKLPLFHTIHQNDRPKQFDFSGHILHELGNDEQFLQKIVFSDQTKFNVSGHINNHNDRIYEHFDG